MDTAFVGGLVHHTATQYAVAVPGSSIYNMLFLNGRPDLGPPLCNYAGNSDGSLTCGAAGVANHAGKSGGRSMGPLPVTDSFNRRVLGLEIVYPGDKPMTDAQYRAACAWARVVSDVVGGGDIERVRAHAETSVTGKWDPGYAPGKTIDMAAFRAAARQGVDMFEQVDRDNLNAIAWRLKAFLDMQGKVTGGPTAGEAVPASENLSALAWRIEAIIKGRETVGGGPTASETNLQAFDLHQLRAEVNELSSKVDVLLVGGVDHDLLASKVAAVLAQRLAD